MIKRKPFEVLYLAAFQGDELISRRMVGRNSSLAGTQKIRVLSNILYRLGGNVEILSVGISANNSGRWYGAFTEALGPGVKAHYCATWDVPVIRTALGLVGIMKMVIRRRRTGESSVVVLYNCDLAEGVGAVMASLLQARPLFLEYEDSVELYGGVKGIVSRLVRSVLRLRVRGIIGVTPEICEEFPNAKKAIVRGVLASDLRSVDGIRNASKVGFTAMYAGSINRGKGVDELCAAWRDSRLNAVRLIVIGDGQALPRLRGEYADAQNIEFLGRVSRADLTALLPTADILINPHASGSISNGLQSPFKLIEYISQGRPIVTTHPGSLEAELRLGCYVIEDNLPESIVHGVLSVISHYPDWLRAATAGATEAWQLYGEESVTDRLSELLSEAI